METHGETRRDMETTIMNITEIKIHPVNEEKLKAYVTVVLDNCFMIRDIKIIKCNSGLFIAMPSKKRKNGQFQDIAHPLNKETRKEFESQIFFEYKNEIKNME